MVVFILTVPVLLLYTTGYFLDSNFNLIKTGGIYIASPVSGSQIFINEQLEKETNILQNSVFTQNLKAKNYSVLVAKDGYSPWRKELEVKPQYVTEARAFLLPEDYSESATILMRDNLTPLGVSDYDDVLQILKHDKRFGEVIASTTPPSIERFALHDKLRLWRYSGENKIRIEWLDKETPKPYYLEESKQLVLDSPQEIRSMDFYPRRSDVIIVARENGIFAIEIDERGGRNIQTIYKGKNPIFTTYGTGAEIYVLDEDILMKIKL